MANVYVQGNNNVVAGRNIQIKDGRVFVDGQEVNTEGGPIILQVEGDVERIEADVVSSIEVSGQAGSVATQAGDVHCGDVSGGVSTMSGDVKCGAVGGGVSTMSGDVHHR